MSQNNHLNLQITQELIYGRAEPQIYAFSTQTVPNYLKIGDTYRPLEIRLNEWRKYFPNLEKQFTDIAKADEETYFRDLAIHLYLENDLQKLRLKKETFPDIPYYSKEFFENATIEDVQKAIEDIKQSHQNNTNKYQLYKFDQSRVPQTYTYTRNQTFKPRPNQQETIDNFTKAVEKGRANLLMYAVMRFGKSFTSLCCATEIDAKIVVVVSAKADVKEEWKKTTESHTRFEDYEFIDSQVLLTNDEIITQKLNEKRNLVIFLTLQDLQGEKIKQKHKELFKNQIDLLIIDETHFGARASEYGKVLQDNGLKKPEINKELKQNDDSLDEMDKSIKILNSKIKLHLSGTPYRILMGSEFTEEDIIAFYQFTDIADDQAKWNEENLLKDEVKEWDNPYYGFPQMVRFAFNPNQSSIDKMEELKKAGITYTFSALFKPKSISKDTKNNKHLEFQHTQEILELLEVIDGTKTDNNLLGFLDYDKIKQGKMCRHIVCVLPYRASCDALEKLILDNKDTFKNLNEYEIINIAGVENEKEYKDTKNVKIKIKEYEKQNQKTLTLTVNRMLTGSTVEEWDTMLYFKDTASPQEYDQAVFRLQNQYIKKFIDETGDIIQYNMKPQTLLVDFDPNRMFVMQEQKAQIYNVNTEANGNLNLEERIQKELQISPIITINSNKMVQVQPGDILDAVRQYSSTKSVLDEAMDIPVDFSLLDIDEMRQEIDKQEEIGSKKGLEIKANKAEGEGENLEITDVENQPENEPQNPANQNQETPKTDDELSKLKKKFATYYSRILFFAFLTNHQIKSLNEILKLIKTDKNSQRIAQNLGIKSQILELFKNHLNPFILSELEYKIQNINSLANDPNLEPVARAGIAMNKFSRLSSSEIVTPQKVVDQMLDIFPEDSINKDDLMLDIASKQGEFVYGVYRKFGKDVANTFYSIPTSKIAYEFTRKVYELLELNINHLEHNYNSYDLIKKDNQLIQNNQIKFNDNFMQFNSIVGNPPYQENDGGAGASARPIYNEFVGMAKKLEPDFISIIMPSRWFAGGKGLDDFRVEMLSDDRIRKIHDFHDASMCFPGVDIKGGICYYLWDKENKGLCEIISHESDGRITQSKRTLLDVNSDVFIRYSEGVDILNQVKLKNEKSLSETVSSRKPFGLATNFDDFTAEQQQNTLKIYANRKTGFVQKDKIIVNPEWINKWKVIIPEAIGKGDIKSDNLKPILAQPQTVCTETYIVVGVFDSKLEAENLIKYIKTKFFHLLLGLKKNTQHTTKKTYQFVPLQDFTSASDIDWSKSIPEIDQQLYKKYGLTEEEIGFIESMIKPMK
jgi:Eco57I restriction-modification methylase/Type III restriction enzyme, res subunit